MSTANAETNQAPQSPRSAQAEFYLEPEDNRRLANLCGHLASHVKQTAKHSSIKIFNRGNHFKVAGDAISVDHAVQIIQKLYRETHNGTEIRSDLIHLLLQEADLEIAHVKESKDDAGHKPIVLRTPKLIIKPRGPNQQKYVRTIQNHDINFGIGPAGTGKTYLAVACAVEALMRDDVQKILLVRPAVEAGEKLGFLPGDLAQKIDPYLRPLYDALHDMLGYEQVTKLQERNVIEIAPLAYMRGRTLSNAYVILDESQNTTPEQMKMFLTRIGFGSKAVVTGDITQVDLPRGSRSGLAHIMNILKNVEGIGFTQFANKDVVRHPLVQRIVDAYDEHDAIQEQKRQEKKASEASSKGTTNDD
jgi:phosphate starvation-inducible protein PhoH and related proteins